MPSLDQLFNYACGQQTCSIGTEPDWLAGVVIALGLVIIVVTVWSIITHDTEPKPPSEVGR